MYNSMKHGIQVRGVPHMIGQRVEAECLDVLLDLYFSMFVWRVEGVQARTSRVSYRLS